MSKLEVNIRVVFTKKVNPFKHANVVEKQWNAMESILEPQITKNTLLDIKEENYYEFYISSKTKFVEIRLIRYYYTYTHTHTHMGSETLNQVAQRLLVPSSWKCSEPSWMGL